MVEHAAKFREIAEKRTVQAAIKIHRALLFRHHSYQPFSLAEADFAYRFRFKTVSCHQDIAIIGRILEINIARIDTHRFLDPSDNVASALSRLGAVLTSCTMRREVSRMDQR